MSLYEYIKNICRRTFKIETKQRKFSTEQGVDLRRCSKTTLSFATDGIGSFKRRPIEDITEANVLGSMIFPNVEYQKYIVPKAAEYHIPAGLEYDDVSINENVSGWENRFKDRMIGLETQQSKLGQTVQHLCDEMIETQKKLRQIPFQEKALDISTEESEQSKIAKTVQHLCDEMIETQKKLRQIPLQEKTLDMITDELAELNKKLL